MLNYLKHTYIYKLASLQAGKTLGQNLFFIYMVGSSSSRLHHFISEVYHVEIQALITDHLISKLLEGILSYHIGYDIPQLDGDESDPIGFQKYLANMTAKIIKYDIDQLFPAIYRDNNPTTVHFMFFLIINGKQPRFSMDYHALSLKSY